MKEFLKKLFLFSLGPIVFCLIIYLFFTYIVNQELKSYNQESGIKTLFVGDSHMQMTIDNHLLPHSINLARDSEGFKYNLLKIKTVLEVNPSINRIFLGFSYHNLSSYCDDFIYGKYAYQISNRYFFILPPSEKIKVLKENIHNLSPFLQGVFKSGLKICIKNKNYFYFGYYQNSFSSTSVVKSSVDKRIDFQYYKDGLVRGFSNVNINDLKKIIQYCKTKNIELILVNTPLNSYYKSRVPKEFIKKHTEIIKQNHLKFIDLSNLISSDSYFIPDGDHVSKEGSIYTTNQFKVNYMIN